MLHLIFQPTFDSSLLNRIENGDDVVFMENAIFRLTKSGLLSDDLQNSKQQNIHLYVLKPDIETRGISVDEVFAGIDFIEYSDLVRLTEKNKVVRTWS